MKKLMGVFLLALGSNALAAGAAIEMDRFPTERVRDMAALQNGARLFSNYCLACHSASLVRWNRLRDLGLSEAQIKDKLIPGDQKVGDPIMSALAPADAKTWLGKAPPDLSVIVRARTSFDYKGTDYLYTLLRGYYRDASTPTGWNNVVLANIAMPHILWERQGPREATIERTVNEVDPKTGASTAMRVVSVYDANGAVTTTRTAAGHAGGHMGFSFKAANPELAARFDGEVADLVAFLAFITDPSAAKRQTIGAFVLLFLAVFTVFAWRLNRVYWKDVK